MITLAKIIEGDKSVIPANKLNIVPTQIVDKSNVEEFAEQHQGPLEEVRSS